MSKVLSGWLFLLLLLFFYVTSISATSSQPAKKSEKQGASQLARGVPHIIFIPGLFGSRIYSCGTHQDCNGPMSSCDRIFGDFDTYTFSNPPNLTRQRGVCYQHELLLNIPSRIQVSIPVYEAIWSYAQRNAGGHPFFHIFSYDWRASNTVSSAELEKRICAIVNNSKPVPLYFIAHSMGGLVLRAWLEQYGYAGCATKTGSSINEVVFVATPHLGSPKVLQAARLGHSVLFEHIFPSSWVTKIKSYVGDPTARAINQAFVDFDSLYELLPVLGGAKCAPDRANPSMGGLPAPMAIAGIKHRAFDIFDGANWEQLSWPIMQGDPGLRRSYYRNSLQKHLDAATAFHCLISKAEKLKRVPRVVQVVGTSENRTFAGYVMDEVKADASFTEAFAPGDGAVPAYSASHLQGDNVTLLNLPYDHVSIMSSKEVLGILSYWRRTANVEESLRHADASKKGRAELLKKIASTREFLPYPLDPSSSVGSPAWNAVHTINEAALAAYPKLHELLTLPMVGDDSFDVAVRAILAAEAASLRAGSRAELHLLAAQNLGNIGRHEEALTLVAIAQVYLDVDVFYRYADVGQLLRLQHDLASVRTRLVTAKFARCVDQVDC